MLNVGSLDIDTNLFLTSATIFVMFFLFGKFIVESEAELYGQSFFFFKVVSISNKVAELLLKKQ